ncbi:D-alanyl-D-alanine carboxypeptidase family protein [Siminovitchia sediminis]|uniref:serine-type D-Ala-D-Ala carboxypeptidase n=1 Tax=Siminovitchia sediminis TaxID=1274353 RepID=A0ABW4KJ70_9BACI
MSSWKGIPLIFISIILMLAAFSKKGDPDFDVSAESAVLMEQDSGRVLYEKKADEVRRIASITKIMTAVLAIESGKMDETVRVSRSAAFAEGSSIYLKPGERIKLRDLVYGLMLRSGNDAANAIAEHLGGSIEGFAFMMNSKAEEIGMTNTFFSNPSGLDSHEKHYSTAYDMALLMRYAMQNETFREISGTKFYTQKHEEGARYWRNKNRLLTEKYKYATGGKTGYTKRAGRTLVTTASRSHENLIAVTLHASDDWNDHIAMYEYGFDEFSMVEVLPDGVIKDVQPFEGKRELYIKHPVRFPLMKEEYSDIRIEYTLLPPKEMKKVKDDMVGRAVIYFENKEVRTIPVYLAEEDNRESKSWIKKLRDLFFLRTDVMLR